MYQLTVGLEGGLGNRMRVAAATASLAPKLQGEVAALWTPQWGMECRFDQLFQPCHQGNFVLRDASLAERLMSARPRPRNLHLSRLVHRVFYRGVIYNDQVTELCRQGFDFVQWASEGPVLLWTWWDFHPWESDLLRQLFRPLPTITQRIDERTADFSTHTIGVHIRRTDHQQSIDQSPTELFLNAIEDEIEMHPDTRVYLATDDEPTKHLLRQRFGKRIITSPNEARRDSTSGIQDALIEMFALSRTVHIFGSAGSSFSEIAAKLGNIPLTILKNELLEQRAPSSLLEWPRFPSELAYP